MSKGTAKATKSNAASEVRPRAKDPFQRRSDADPVPGERVRVTRGERKGLVGVYDSVRDIDDTGHAKIVRVDFNNVPVDVAYNALERAPRP